MQPTQKKSKNWQMHEMYYGSQVIECFTILGMLCYFKPEGFIFNCGWRLMTGGPRGWKSLWIFIYSSLCSSVSARGPSTCFIGSQVGSAFSSHTSTMQVLWLLRTLWIKNMCLRLIGWNNFHLCCCRCIVTIFFPIE